MSHIALIGLRHTGPPLVRDPALAEGVRARLIDKDQPPRWHGRDVASIPAEVIESHFVAVWDGAHPLADL